MGGSESTTLAPIRPGRFVEKASAFAREPESKHQAIRVNQSANRIANDLLEEHE